MRVIGIDPGLSATGYCVLDNGIICTFGEIKTTSKMLNRLAFIYDSLSDIVRSYSPEFGVLEKTFVNCNGKTSLLLGQATGIAALCLQKYAVKYSCIFPSVAKKHITGKGTATTEEIKEKLNLSGDWSHNVIDAIAIAYCFNCEFLVD